MGVGNVILVGMMGSGKSTIGRLVAESTGMEFIDLDAMIVARDGREISEIFSHEGEAAFRRKETAALVEIAGASNAVVATGGGVVTRAENRRLLKELGKVVWLDAPAETLLERIGDDESRPMLRGGDALKRLVSLQAERRGDYAEASDIHLDTSEHAPAELVGRIARLVGQAREAAGEDDLFDTIVAIDGPVGSGKSALARRVAAALRYTHVDTGAMYRCVALEATRRGAPMDDADALTAVAHSIDIRFLEAPAPPAGAAPAPQRVLLNGDDVTDDVRRPEIGRATSAVADVPTVRKELVDLQRQMALRGRSVLEGRDISTVVVPEARWKFYLTAGLDERVRRRLNQHRKQGDEITPDQVRKDIVARDHRDRTRPQGALKLSPDATIIDTTDMPLDEVVTTVVALVAAP